MEYYDTDSIYYDIKKLNQYTDILKVVGPTAKQIMLKKIYLNSLYGKMMSCIHFTDGKENNGMIKGLDYILIHVEKVPVIILIKQIVSVTKYDNDCRAFIQCTTGAYISDERYSDIVKQLL